MVVGWAKDFQWMNNSIKSFSQRKITKQCWKSLINAFALRRRKIPSSYVPIYMKSIWDMYIPYPMYQGWDKK